MFVKVKKQMVELVEEEPKTGSHILEILLALILAAFMVWMLWWMFGNASKADDMLSTLTDREIAAINHAAQTRAIGDCTITRTDYGFKAVADDGKVYKIIVKR